jgi:hypothetical protein
MSPTALSRSASTPPMMRLAVFDLDYTVWQPEMYQLYGPPKLVARPSDSRSNGSRSRTTKSRHKHREEGWTLTNRKDMVLMDSQGSVMELFPGA